MGEAQSARIQGFKLLFDLEILCMHWKHVQLAEIKKKKRKKFENDRVLIDSTKKTLGYRVSCKVTFENFQFFRFFGGKNGGCPNKIIFFPKKNKQ